ncbi:MBL fold metallo-hydrolase [Nakamurella antarctica]|uniref:MBL fold metallo-hydrolase n=1 Tax=Nakamurella antarctica TaxID=1902245 RepID=A0A3G8ZP75_9ACTN|nr:MBL fold metallo-hydrolase [Nakamurella antarctica]AZI59060.1 MBL fold metallo-hydrolase [Nakamurella antarctica]
MKITKFGHSCLLVETGNARILTDPGAFSTGFGAVGSLDAVLITHLHADHLDLSRISALLAANPLAVMYADPGSVTSLAEIGITAAGVHAGDVLEIGDVTVEVFGDIHAVIHHDLPNVENRGYLIAGRLYLPGDSLSVPANPVEILALPTMAPWMAVKESIEFLRTVDPTVAIPIHEAMLASTDIVYGLLQKLKPADTQWLNIDDGQAVEL